MLHLIIRFMADGLLIPIVLIGVYMLVFRVQKSTRYEAYCRVLLAGLTSFLIARLLASVYQPDIARPFELLHVTAGALYLNNPGFPSDHALFAAAITCAVWFETRSKKATVLLIILTLLVCCGRVLAQVHTPLDVIGGIIVALIGAGWYLTARPVVHVHRKKNTASL